ncbi:galectin-3-binding protein-like [Babylonia areolata]|uniref:galectin-3-binding protein-like n=1 Tax=Babylonia areolata TaxID=304850 RepID=UPI003FD5D132
MFDLELRLFGGSEKEGRVEVRLPDGDWGGICPTEFDNSDARVVCRQLRLGDSGQVIDNAPHGSPPDHMFLDLVWCQGTEQNIAHCDHWGWREVSSDCHPSVAVSVRCSGEIPAGGSLDCSDGSNQCVTTAVCESNTCKTKVGQTCPGSNFTHCTADTECVKTRTGSNIFQCRKCVCVFCVCVRESLLVAM